MVCSCMRWYATSPAKCITASRNGDSSTGSCPVPSVAALSCQVSGTEVRSDTTAILLLRFLPTVIGALCGGFRFTSNVDIELANSENERLGGRFPVGLSPIPSADWGTWDRLLYLHRQRPCTSPTGSISNQGRRCMSLRPPPRGLAERIGCVPVPRWSPRTLVRAG
jgi:hypothetical protein